MGYTRKPKIYNLVFGPESDYDGLEVNVTSMPVGELMDIAELQEKAGGDDLEAITKLLEQFASHLKGWNLEEEDGNPVPATFEGLRGQDLEFVLALISHWTEAIASVAQDLGKGSKSGGTSVEERLPMEALS
jgi:hypothetical protein